MHDLTLILWYSVAIFLVFSAYRRMSGRFRNWYDHHIRHQIVLECRCSCGTYLRIALGSTDVALANEWVSWMNDHHIDHELVWTSAG